LSNVVQLKRSVTAGNPLSCFASRALVCALLRRVYPHLIAAATCCCCFLQRCLYQPGLLLVLLFVCWQLLSYCLSQQALYCSCLHAV
jgi:hypothetical protein